MNFYNSGVEKRISDDKKVREFTYEIIHNATDNFASVIGEGGFGTVYRGRIGDRLVAVKKLESPEAKEFITELNTLTRFEHENLLSIIGYCKDPNCPSIVLEYMPNGSLDDRLKLANIADRTIMEADTDGDHMISFEEFCATLERTDVEEKMSIRFLH